MQRTLRLPIVLAALHLLIGAIHASAHQALGIFGSPFQLAFIALVIYAVPVLALVQLLKGSRAAAGWLLAALTGSFLFGVYYHFIADTPDHVCHLPAGAWSDHF